MKRKAVVQNDVAPGWLWRWRARVQLLVRPQLESRPTAVTLLGQPLLLQFRSGREIDRVASFSREATLVRRMLDHLRPGDTVYDVGANIGLISLVLALHPAGRQCRGHSFEPEPRNFRQLQRNIAANQIGDRLTPHQLALGCETGEAGLFVRGSAGEGRHSLVASSGATSRISVAISTVSDFARATGEPPDVVKIDVEGAEGQVLAGMETLLATHRPRDVFLEIHNKGDRDRLPGGKSIEDWAHHHGYAMEWEQRRRSGRHRHYRARTASLATQNAEP